jgi:hypothetical protein
LGTRPHGGHGQGAQQEHRFIRALLGCRAAAYQQARAWHAEPERREKEGQCPAGPQATACQHPRTPPERRVERESSRRAATRRTGRARALTVGAGSARGTGTGSAWQGCAGPQTTARQHSSARSTRHAERERRGEAPPLPRRIAPDGGRDGARSGRARARTVGAGRARRTGRGSAWQGCAGPQATARQHPSAARGEVEEGRSIATFESASSTFPLAAAVVSSTLRLPVRLPVDGRTCGTHEGRGIEGRRSKGNSGGGRGGGGEGGESGSAPAAATAEVAASAGGSPPARSRCGTSSAPARRLSRRVKPWGVAPGARVCRSCRPRRPCCR